jgi:RimJ/RimL family protein N-acetyltransferase
MNFIVRHPVDCTPGELAQFHALVIKGGQVSEEGLYDRIEGAHSLGFCYDGPKLVGVAALKRPAEEHKQEVFNRASVANPEDFTIEIGWAFTEVSHRRRGIATCLFTLLLCQTAGQVYATTRTNNEICKRILGRCGFNVSGEPFDGCTSQIAFYTRSET